MMKSGRQKGLLASFLTGAVLFQFLATFSGIVAGGYAIMQEDRCRVETTALNWALADEERNGFVVQKSLAQTGCVNPIQTVQEICKALTNRQTCTLGELGSWLCKNVKPCTSVQDGIAAAKNFMTDARTAVTTYIKTKLNSAIQILKRVPIKAGYYAKAAGSLAWKGVKGFSASTYSQAADATAWVKTFITQGGGAKVAYQPHGYPGIDPSLPPGDQSVGELARAIDAAANGTESRWQIIKQAYSLAKQAAGGTVAGFKIATNFAVDTSGKWLSPILDGAKAGGGAIKAGIARVGGPALIGLQVGFDLAPLAGALVNGHQLSSEAVSNGFHNFGLEDVFSTHWPGDPSIPSDTASGSSQGCATTYGVASQVLNDPSSFANYDILVALETDSWNTAGVKASGGFNWTDALDAGAGFAAQKLTDITQGVQLQTWYGNIGSTSALGTGPPPCPWAVNLPHSYWAQQMYAAFQRDFRIWGGVGNSGELIFNAPIDPSTGNPVSPVQNTDYRVWLPDQLQNGVFTPDCSGIPSVLNGKQGRIGDLLPNYHGGQATGSIPTNDLTDAVNTFNAETINQSGSVTQQTAPLVVCAGGWTLDDILNFGLPNGAYNAVADALSNSDQVEVFNPFSGTLESRVDNVTGQTVTAGHTVAYSELWGQMKSGDFSNYDILEQTAQSAGDSPDAKAFQASLATLTNDFCECKDPRTPTIDVESSSTATMTDDQAISMILGMSDVISASNPDMISADGNMGIMQQSASQFLTVDPGGKLDPSSISDQATAAAMELSNDINACQGDVVCGYAQYVKENHLPAFNGTWSGGQYDGEQGIPNPLKENVGDWSSEVGAGGGGPNPSIALTSDLSTVAMSEYQIYFNTPEFDPNPPLVYPLPPVLPVGGAFPPGYTSVIVSGQPLVALFPTFDSSINLPQPFGYQPLQGDAVGQCSWYASTQIRVGQLEGPQDGGQWYANAVRMGLKTLPSTVLPPVGAAVSWLGGAYGKTPEDAAKVGHVAVVIEDDPGGGGYIVAEMNYSGVFNVDYRHVHFPDPYLQGSIPVQ